MINSMTINATAALLLELFVAEAERQGVQPSALKGNTRLILTTNSDFLRLIKQFETDPGPRTSSLPRGGN